MGVPAGFVTPNTLSCTGEEEQRARDADRRGHVEIRSRRALSRRRGPARLFNPLWERCSTESITSGRAVPEAVPPGRPSIRPRSVMAGQRSAALAPGPKERRPGERGTGGSLGTVPESSAGSAARRARRAGGCGAGGVVGRGPVPRARRLITTPCSYLRSRAPTTQCVTDEPKSVR